MILRRLGSSPRHRFGTFCPGAVGMSTPARSLRRGRRWSGPCRRRLGRCARRFPQTPPRYPAPAAFSRSRSLSVLPPRVTMAVIWPFSSLSAFIFSPLGSAKPVMWFCASRSTAIRLPSSLRRKTISAPSALVQVTRSCASYRSHSDHVLAQRAPKSRPPPRSCCCRSDPA